MTPTPTPTSGAADRAIEDCPELNMGNYDEVDVERLNDWAIRAHDEIDRLHALAAERATAAPAQPAAQQGVAYAALPYQWREKVAELADQLEKCGVAWIRTNGGTTYNVGRNDGAKFAASELRKVLADETEHVALRASHGQAPAVATLPEGWVPLTITHEGQYPEEVAYGPQIMMDRLGKWLGKYFAQAAQEDSVQEDAARYRWLRAPTTDVALVLDKRTEWVPPDDVVPGVGGYWVYEYRAGDELDEAVDAARARLEGKT